MIAHEVESPVWQLHNVDCRDWLKACESGRFHAVITDPPYRVVATSAVTKRTGSAKNIYGNNAPPRYDEWIPECYRVLKPGGSFFVFEHPNNWHVLTHAVEKAGFEIVQTIIYHVKNRHGLFPGEFFNHYDVCIYAVEPPYSGRVFNMSPPGGGGLAFRDSSDVYTTTWRGENGRVDLDTPGRKDVQFLRTLVYTTTNPGDWVLDPFAGTGTTLRAALAEGRNAVGCEVRKNVADEVRRRLKESSALPW